MTELEKLAKDYADWTPNSECETTAEALSSSFTAGFLKAREMAAELADESSPNAGDALTSDQIRQLGESEASQS